MTFIEELKQLGIDDAVIDVIATNFAGMPVYIPKRKTVDLNARNAAIRRAFNGRNTNDLARRYQLTSQHIRRILTNDLVNL
jgi:Mor family transcriptional regulator